MDFIQIVINKAMRVVCKVGKKCKNQGFKENYELDVSETGSKIP